MKLSDRISELEKEIELLEQIGKKTGRLFCPRCDIEFGTHQDATKHFKKTKPSGDYNTYTRPKMECEVIELKELQIKLSSLKEAASLKQTEIIEMIENRQISRRKNCINVKNGRQCDKCELLEQEFINLIKQIKGEQN
jgi:uncharacterized C2H2 Zn-finger protein